MDVNIFTITGLIFLIVVGFFVIGAVLFGIEKLIERRRAMRRDLTRSSAISGEEAGTYGPEECYRDCTRTSYPYSEREYPSCAEACGLSK